MYTYSQYTEEADLCSQMFWIGGNGAQASPTPPGTGCRRIHCLGFWNAITSITVGTVNTLTWKYGTCETVPPARSAIHWARARPWHLGQFSITARVVTRCVGDHVCAATFDVTTPSAGPVERQLSIAIIARRRAPESDAPCCSRKAEARKRRNTSAASEPFARHGVRPSGGHQGGHLGCPGVQGFHRTGPWRRPCFRWWRYLQITRCGVQAAMPQQ